MAIGIASLRRWIPPGPFGSSMPGADGSFSSRGQMRRCRWPARSDIVRMVRKTVP